ncbi:rho GTPase-activating protein 30-like [Tympanuchus pallidicinctus]|uniref:rho GTPase-activating protein 30-like n=1 Tax=Tympanuchus pallidicinctus TaxID=109042 RepID=UPI002286DA22|nr:rho GTPase-activating protein 30-like [Tympanuchus pallidicinctus]
MPGTLVFLMRHLACLSANSSVTNMHAKNLAIVWAPNLLRSQQSESACASGRAACTELQTQSAVVEFIIDHTDVLFCSTSGPDIADGAGECLPPLALSWSDTWIKCRPSPRSLKYNFPIERTADFWT